MATMTKLPIFKGSDLEATLEKELESFAIEEAARLGLSTDPKSKHHWVDTMTAPVVRKREKDEVELMVSGLTPAQDQLVESALRGLGYKVRWIGTSDQKSFQVGKEFGNRGQCNPTHFTVGHLVKELIRLRDEEGFTSEQIVKDRVFLTAGACGPCRFGMYVTEYRKALRDAGFEGFRVMLFQQQGGISQVCGDDVGLVYDPPFFLAIARAIIAGDVLNAIGWRIRPYELEAGATDRALTEAKRLIGDALADRSGEPWRLFARALVASRKVLGSVAIDPLRVRARVSVIGEFWALHTEGDGNYNLKSFLESEGAECIVQPVAATILYNVWEVARDTEERLAVRGADKALWGLGDLDELGAGKRLVTMRILNQVLRGAFQSIAKLTGLHGYELPDMWRIAELAKDLYAHDLRGGEGHLEVGKLVMNAVDKKSHMVASVKPFGCMPSSGVSDGVQSLVQSRFANVPFVAVETSGDGAANFYSRVLMTLFAAKRAAEDELTKAYAETGVTEAEVRAFLAAHPRYASPLRPPAKTTGITGRAALLVHEVAPLVKTDRKGRVVVRARRVASSLTKTTAAAVKSARTSLAALRTDAARERMTVDVKLLGELTRAHLAARLGRAGETPKAAEVAPAREVSRATPTSTEGFAATAEE